MVTVRVSTVEDLLVLVEFQIRIAFESEGVTIPRETVLRGVQGFYDVPSRGFYLVAEENGEIIGCTMYTYEWIDS
jgi:hypothetical protein